MTLLLQLPHGAPHVDLGADGRVLYVFQCADLDRQGCSAFQPEDGGHACFILDSKEQTGSVTAAPASAAEVGSGWSLVNWHCVEDLNEDPDDIPEGMENGPSSQTKLGGAPFWIQRDETPTGPWRFLFQIETDMHALSDWEGIAGGGIGSVFVRSDGIAEARLIWQCT